MEYVKTESHYFNHIHFKSKCEVCGNVERGLSGNNTSEFWESFRDHKCKKCGESTNSILQGAKA